MLTFRLLVRLYMHFSSIRLAVRFTIYFNQLKVLHTGDCKRADQKPTTHSLRYSCNRGCGGQRTSPQTYWHTWHAIRKLCVYLVAKCVFNHSLHEYAVCKNVDTCFASCTNLQMANFILLLSLNAHILHI